MGCLLLTYAVLVLVTQYTTQQTPHTQIQLPLSFPFVQYTYFMFSIVTIICDPTWTSYTETPLVCHYYFTEEVFPNLYS